MHNSAPRTADITSSNPPGSMKTENVAHPPKEGSRVLNTSNQDYKANLIPSARDDSTPSTHTPMTFKAYGQVVNGATIIPRIGYAALVHFNKGDAYRRLHHRFGCDGREKRDLFDISGCQEAHCECGDFSLRASETCICGHALSRHKSTPLESLKADFRKYLAQSGKANNWSEFEGLVRPAEYH